MHIKHDRNAQQAIETGRRRGGSLTSVIAPAMPVRHAPHNIEAEQALLGALLLSNRALDDVAGIISSGDFYEPLHARIYERVAAMAQAGRVADPLTLKAHFEADPPIGALPVPAYLGRLTTACPSIINAGSYAATVRDLAVRRRLIEIGERMVEDAYSAADEPPAEQIERAERSLFDIAMGHDEPSRPFVCWLDEAIASAEQAYIRGTGMAGLSTGFVALDGIMGGLCEGELIILGGRPSMGKSALAGSIALNVARAGSILDGGRAEPAPTAFFSLEMTQEALARRELAGDAGLSASDIKRGRLNGDADFRRLIAARDRLRDIPLWIERARDATPEEIMRRTRRLIREKGVRFVVIDYLQLLRSTVGIGSNQQVSHISGMLKTMASELRIPVMALSQLSRQSQNRQDKRPMLSDLRDSGSIEQDADMVMFVHREEYYLERAEPDAVAEPDAWNRWNREMIQWRGKGEVLLPKQRDGQTGKVVLSWDGSRGRFGDVSDRAA